MKKLAALCMIALTLFSASSSNSGTRHEIALSPSAQAEAYYTEDYEIRVLLRLAGSASESSAEAWESPLCQALHARMSGTLASLPSYNDTILLFSNTDVSGGAEEPTRFYRDDLGAYNREEVWANPHGTFYHDGAGRDLHHLRPTDAEANMVRGSMVFGDVRERFPNCRTWPDAETPVFWYAEDWNDGVGLVEVRDEIKGDVARILLYVYTVYGGEDGANRNLWTDLSETGTGMEASDGIRVIENLDTLLEWIALDPVDTWELGRNDVVQELQGNRNVFIDYPELAFLLFDREIPDMDSPSGLAHSLQFTVTATADPPEGGTVDVEQLTVTAVPNPGWEVEGWTLSPEDAAAVTQEGNIFRLDRVQEDCTLTVCFCLVDPCALGHTWNEGTVTTAPACEDPGVKTFTCTVCGAIRTESVPALGHDWHVQNIGPTCIQAGYTLEACWRCGLEIETPGDPALGHDWDSGVVTRPATQSQPGERTYRCTRCGLTRTEEFPFRFDDVRNENAWYFIPVYWALYHQPSITSGTSPNLFSPNQKCTRAQIVTFLWRAYGCQEPTESGLPFLDVPPDAYYRKAVLWAVEKGITSGTTPETFSPKDTCTRGQVVTFLWAAAGRPEPESEDMPFTDVPGNAYYRKAVLWAVEQGITSGTATETFSPRDSCTRAQAVTMLWKLLGTE